MDASTGRSILRYRAVIAQVGERAMRETLEFSTTDPYRPRVVVPIKAEAARSLPQAITATQPAAGTARR
jgi:hypothetical protein